MTSRLPAAGPAEKLYSRSDAGGGGRENDGAGAAAAEISRLVDVEPANSPCVGGSLLSRLLKARVAGAARRRPLDAAMGRESRRSACILITMVPFFCLYETFMAVDGA